MENETKVTIDFTKVVFYDENEKVTKELEVFGKLTQLQCKEVLKPFQKFITKDVRKDVFMVDSSELLKLKK